MARAFIGTSGWNYRHWWNGVFYKKQLKPHQWLGFFSRHFDTVEVNNTFYRLPGENAFRSWREQVPEDFVFGIKASRFLTHIKRLKDPEDPLDLFLSRAKHLGNRLGPVLFQLPPNFKCDLERLERFLLALKKHGSGQKLQCVLEVRDPTWLVSPVFQLLVSFRVALCLADWRDMPVTGPLTADFVYVRRHYGQAGGGNYGRAELNADVRQVRQWLCERKNVYMYFNNDMSGFAIRNARYVRNALRSLT